MSDVRLYPLNKIAALSDDSDKAILVVTEGTGSESDAAEISAAIGAASTTASSIDTALSTATTTQEDSIRASIDAEDNHSPYHRLSRWRDRLGLVKGTSGVAPVIALNGDSMINQAVDQLQNAITPTLGVSGVAFAPAVPDTGGAVALADPTRWFNWQGVRLSGTGHIAWVNTASADLSAGDTIKVYYITQPSGGVFKVQTRENGGAWTDEAAHVSVNSSGTLGGAVITITKATFRKTYSVRCVWVSGGNVDIVGFGVYIANHRGVRFAQMHRGGGEGNLVDWITQDPAIFNPIVKDIGLDLVIFSHLDGDTGVNSYQAQWQDLVSRAGAVSINSITWSSGPPAAFTVTTSSAHGLAAGDMVKIEDSSVAGYNAQWWAVSTVPTSTTFTCAAATDTGSASGGTVAREPSWVIIGPPVGDDTEQDGFNDLQAQAMKALAFTRQDAYWDNRRWAEGVAAAVYNQHIAPGDVHYSVVARRNWVAKMILDTGLLDCADRWDFAEGISFNKGGSLRRYRNVNLGLPAPVDAEFAGNFRICNPDGTTGNGTLFVEDATTPGATATAQFRRNNNAGLLGLTGVDLWAYDGGSGTGSFWYHFGSTAGTPLGNLGANNVPIRALFLAKTITATGTTAAQTINKSAGSVNFAAGDASKVVTNNLVVAQTSGQTGSIIIATVRTNDATMKSVSVVCSSSGSFTIHANAVPTAETRVDWVIIAP